MLSRSSQDGINKQAANSCRMRDHCFGMFSLDLNQAAVSAPIKSTAMWSGAFGRRAFPRTKSFDTFAFTV